jgi:hypothetical protein
MLASFVALFSLVAYASSPARYGNTPCLLLSVRRGARSLPDPYRLSKKEECMNHGRGERTDHLPIFYKTMPERISRLTGTIRGFQLILSGELDGLPEQAFYLVGNIDEAGERRDSITLTLPEGGKSRVGFGRREGSSHLCCLAFFSRWGLWVISRMDSAGSSCKNHFCHL